jgi:hypothetical protein
MSSINPDIFSSCFPWKAWKDEIFCLKQMFSVQEKDFTFLFCPGTQRLSQWDWDKGFMNPCFSSNQGDLLISNRGKIAHEIKINISTE